MVQDNKREYLCSCAQQPLATHGNVALLHTTKPSTLYNALNRHYSVTLSQPHVVTVTESQP